MDPPDVFIIIKHISKAEKLDVYRLCLNKIDKELSKF
jgi:hypothetical protein